MKTNLFVILFLICLVFGCSDGSDPEANNGDVFFEYLESVPYVDIPKENLPEWLILRINNIEKRPSSISNVKIYKGEWGKQTAYFIMDTFSSCFCDFYTEDGERIIENISDLYDTDKNWILFYEYGEF